VGGFNTWLKCGRYVRKGEKGIAILAPMFFKDKKQKPEDEETTRLWFRVVYVFDRLSRDLRPSLCTLDVIRQCHFREPPSIAASTSSLNSSALRNAPSCRGSSYRNLLPINPGSERERRITTVNFRLARHSSAILERPR
jgi:hypothetical protein